MWVVKSNLWVVKSNLWVIKLEVGVGWCDLGGWKLKVGVWVGVGVAKFKKFVEEIWGEIATSWWFLILGNHKIKFLNLYHSNEVDIEWKLSAKTQKTKQKKNMKNVEKRAQLLSTILCCPQH